MRAAIYARVSSDEQVKGYSLPQQLDECRKFAEQRGMAVVAVFEEDYTGTKTARPELDKLRDMIDDGRVDAVIVHELDRLGRKAVVWGLIEEEFERKSVKIHYVVEQYSDTEEGRLMKQMRASVAEYDRGQILRRMKRGKIGKVKAGSVLTYDKRPYGYDLVNSTGANGRKESMLVVNVEEAKIVVIIFKLYVESGYSIYLLADHLTRLRIPTLADNDPKRQQRKVTAPGTWHPNVVRQILKNTVYIGKWRFNQFGEQMTVDVPPIIDVALFEAAQRQIQANIAQSRRNTRHEYLLRGMLTCQCGRGLMAITIRKHSGKEYSYYICHSRTDAIKSQRGICKLPYIPAATVDNAVWNWVESLLRDVKMMPGSWTFHVRLAMRRYHLRNAA